MKKIFVALGALFLCLIISGVIGVLIFSYFGAKLDKQSKAYADEIIPIIVASWDPQELIKRASPELLNVAPIHKLNTLFKMSSEKLGGLKKYKGSSGQAGIHIGPDGKIITGTYAAEVVFEKGAATIQIRVIQRNNKWEIAEFYVNSDAFMP